MKSDFSFDLLDALQAPVLTFTQMWADTIPQRLLDKVPFARLIMLRKNVDYCSLLEALIYIYTRTFESPMGTDWVNIYTNISCKVLQQYFNEDHWEEIQAPKNLNNYEKQLLMELRRWIYSKRRKILKERLKKDKKENNKEQVEKTKELIQLTFKF